MAGGRRLRARVVRRAPALDLAALEVEGDLGAGRQRRRLGRAARRRPGGRRRQPDGRAQRAQPGYSSPARPDDVLRLSITLRPGNSGGALVNARGEVVGIPHMVTGNGLALAVSTPQRARAF